jgi:hypothetical protein
MTEAAKLEALHYAILGAQPGASHAELRRAYIARVLRAKAEAEMKPVNLAYDYLSRLGHRPPSSGAARWTGNRAQQGWAAQASRTPPTKSEPHWSAGVVAAFGCYGAMRLAATIAAWSFPVVVAAAWAYTLIQGLRNKLVVFASIKDVVLSLLAGTVMFAGQLTGSICTSLIGLLLCVISAIWSIRRNGGIITGLTVCLFKVTFAPCWLALILAPWFLSASDNQQGASKIRPTIFCGLLAVLMWKLVNGRH